MLEWNIFISFVEHIHSNIQESNPLSSSEVVPSGLPYRNCHIRVQPRYNIHQRQHSQNTYTASAGIQYHVIQKCSD